MIIRVSGYPGAGKTTLCNRLIKALGYEYHAASSIFRKVAEERGMTIEAFYASLAVDPDFEREVDKAQEKLLASKQDLIVDGRIAPFLPCPFPSLSILLLVDPTEAARRNLGRPENRGRSLEEMRAQTERRIADERAHYQKLYGIDDHLGPKHFDLTIDTTNLMPEDVFTRVMERLAAQSARESRPLAPEAR